MAKMIKRYRLNTPVSGTVNAHEAPLPPLALQYPAQYAMQAGHRKRSNEATMGPRNLQDCYPSIPGMMDTKNTDTYCVWMRMNMVPTCHASQDRGRYTPLTGWLYHF